jgi:predicted amidohydrolase
MSTIRVALLQLTAHANGRISNQSKGELFCRQAHQMNADIALFPEMWNIGYTLPDLDRQEERLHWQKKAINRDHPFVLHFRELARELQMSIALTYLEQWQGAPRNSVSIIDRHGDIILTYAKVHTCDFDKESACTPGEGFSVCTLDTKNGAVQVGVMICYDREFPESARILMLKGAEIILTPNACTLDHTRIDQFKTRAFENMVGVAMANYAAPQQNGHSVAFNAVFYDKSGEPVNPLLAEANEEEGIYLADFNMEEMRAYRERESWGNAFRKPRSYDLLISPDVSPPFIRSDARR